MLRGALDEALVDAGLLATILTGYEQDNNRKEPTELAAT